ncbi:MAG: DNA repair protein RecN [Bacteroidota bacterium]|nr:DNA repair protein RecN [Bacteroidota bacterium]
MLVSLKIENYALIKECEISFPNGFVAITGETGAGKSILLGALSLVLGQRADVNVLMDKEKKCIVEAVFETKEDLKSIFETNDIDYDTTSYFRREILPSGKSRAFVNDTPVQLPILKQFADKLIDIHSQSSTSQLKDSAFQLSLLDSMAQNKEILNSYQNTYRKYENLLSEIEGLEKQKSENLKEYSYNEFLFNELDKANLNNKNEQEELENEIELLSNAEQIKEGLYYCLNLLDNNEESNTLLYLNNVKHQLSKIQSHSETLNNLYNRVDSAFIELKDIFEELNDYNETLNFDNDKLQADNERLDLIYSLEKKHNVLSIKELQDIKTSLSEKLFFVDNVSNIIEEKEKDKKLYLKELEDLSKKLHKQRSEVATLMEKNILPLLKSMAMQDAVLKIEVEENKEFTLYGRDSVTFLFAANKTKDNKLSPINKVISGGELSRLMLAIKAVVAENFALPTMIFDEIDTGISGDVAAKAGEIMLQLGKKHQVITITHLVQVAAKAIEQLKVYKQRKGEETFSNIVILSQEERINEIAQMLSDGKESKESINLAKKLLQ